MTKAKTKLIETDFYDELEEVFAKKFQTSTVDRRKLFANKSNATKSGFLGGESVQEEQLFSDRAAGSHRERIFSIAGKNNADFDNSAEQM